SQRASFATLARFGAKTQAELNEQMARIRAMSKLVEHVSQCRCADLSEWWANGRFGYENRHEMKSLLWYLVAALCEIGGCFSFWAWLRMHRSPLWTIPGLMALSLFALALTRVDAANAGRTLCRLRGPSARSTCAASPSQPSSRTRRSWTTVDLYQFRVRGLILAAAPCELCI